MKLTPLHARFGMAVDDVDLRTVTQDHLYGAIREAFEKHSALLFRGQLLDDAEHVRLARLFGPLENRDAMASGRDVDFEVSAVSNVLGEDQIADPESLHTLNLQGQHVVAHRQHLSAGTGTGKPVDGKGIAFHRR